MKCLFLFFFVLSFLGCRVKEVQRLWIIKIQNESGMPVTKMKAMFETEDGIVIDDPIIITGIANNTSKEVKYNLENMHGFQEISAVITAEFTNPKRNFRKVFVSFDERKLYSDFTVTIKPDTLIVVSERKKI